MSSRRCIFCLEEREVKAFNTEHVVPQAFGRFRNNLTLTCVCSECNSSFSKLELVFARDSIEAVLRAQHGLRTAEELASFPRRRVTFALVDEGGDCHGLWVELRVANRDLVYSPVPQVRFVRAGGSAGWEYVTESELRDHGLPAGVDPTSAQIVARSDEDKSRVAALLATKGGPSPKRWQSAGILPAPAERPGGPAFDIKGTIDRMVLRCVAKIALNYTAYVAGPEFSLGPDFNAIRSFARHGASAGRPLVIPSSPPGLIVRPAATRRNVGHTLGITWTDDSRHLACEASFFDAFIYTVALARDYQGVWREVRSVHRFDLVTREAIELPPACYARL